MYHKFGLIYENTEMFIHFPPSYWRLHIHFVPRPHVSPVYHQLYFINDIIESDIKHIAATNEGEAIGIAVGAELVGKKSCVYLINFALEIM